MCASVRKGLADGLCINCFVEANWNNKLRLPVLQLLKYEVASRIASMTRKQKICLMSRRLLRILMKIDESEKRRELLFDYFLNRRSMDNDGVVLTEGAPIVHPFVY